MVKIVRRRPALFPALIKGMYHEDKLVRMRAADAVEKPTLTNPGWLRPFKRRLIALAACAEQKELRWHLAQMLPRLELSRRDRMVVAAIFRGYLQDQSRIVKTFAMQGLPDLAMQDPGLRNSIRPLISSLTKTGSLSMKSRGQKLMLQLAASTSPRPAPVSR